MLYKVNVCFKRYIRNNISRVCCYCLYDIRVPEVMDLYKRILISIVVLSISLIDASSSVLDIENGKSDNIALAYIVNENCAPRNKVDIADQLYNSIIVADYESAVTKCLKLENEGRGEIIITVVKRLLNESKKNTIEFAYRLWYMFGKNIVKDYFPIQFRLLLNEDSILISNKRDGFALNLDTVTDGGDRLTFGDSHDKTSNQVSWRVLPIWENNRVYFKIENNYRHQFIKLEILTDASGGHRTWSSDSHDTFRHQWYLHPVKYDNEVLFFIYNREYNKALKLSSTVDANGNRILWGHNGNVTGNPEHYGWIISPFS